MKRKKEQEGKRVNKEEVEDWCFICKDGGNLILCDYPGCLKVYHPGCAGRKKCSIDSKKRWICRRHSCTFCLGTPRFSCFLCPNSVCRHCTAGSDFMLLRGNNGFCKNCLKLVLLAEENSRTGFNGEEIDFNDRDTSECLFKEYWEIVKENEGLTLDDVCSANLQLEKGENEDCVLDSVKDGEGEECVDLTKSDSDSDNTILQKPMMAKRKAPKAQEYVGWGSKPLIEFLRSIGKDTTERLSQLDVDSIIDDYTKERNLFHPTKKRRIICDDRLHAIFRRKSLDRFKKYGLLEKHIIQDSVFSDEDGNDEDDAERNKDTVVECKKEKVGSDISCEKEVSPRIQLSGFASIISKNLKLVYLRKSLVEELLRQPAYSESKVLGSFVRVKNDPGDFLQRNSHQLLQIEGIVKISPRKEMNSEFLLQVSNSKREIPIFQLSDADFTEEECEELRQNVMNGLLKKPTVVELEQKARDLHEDITKHWIQRELVRLQNSIDQANLKGWRRELLEFLGQRERLKQPDEQERLLENVPKVIGEVLEAESDTPHEVH